MGPELLYMYVDGLRVASLSALQLTSEYNTETDCTRYSGKLRLKPEALLLLDKCDVSITGISSSGCPVHCWILGMQLADELWDNGMQEFEAEYIKPWKVSGKVSNE